MGITQRFYGLDILTSMVGTNPRKYTFRDEQEAIWAAHMASTMLNLQNRIILEPEQSLTKGWHIGASVRYHDPGPSFQPAAFMYVGCMLRLEYQTNLKHLFDEHT